MISQKILKLIIKYLNRQATLLERNELESWLEKDNNYKLFKGYVKINYLIDLNMDMFDTDDSKKELLELINKEKKQFKIRKYTRLMKYAAIAILFLGIGYFYQQGYFTKDSEIIIPKESVTLQLENGNIEVLNEDGSKNIIDNQGNLLGAQNGSLLVYNNSISKEKLVYNTLSVPYGKRFEIKLSDGTNVHLNAGSSLKYPVKFIEGEIREVFSEGQVYFDVAKDEDHPFVVTTDKISVRVLGTQFSVSSYTEDKDVSTVLVEGTVSIYDNNKSYSPETATLLSPGFKADWNKKEGRIKIQVADIEMQTAWIDGKIIFRHVPFENIVKKLERHYNVEIINNNKGFSKDLITASFDVETIEEVFKVISEIHPINYKIESNTVIIN
ncbi:FecR family protein [Litoribaculum gwangyangense]|uniref:FecR family protein n=1 Tax=Litoribaculum gwangyangense TaxID=1130722 RepID=A0ABP9CKZ1_9FLAO